MTDAKHKRRNEFASVGRRKTATARVRYSKRADGNGEVTINGKPLAQYAPAQLRDFVLLPITLLAQPLDGNFSVRVSGGGTHAQAHAVQHGITRILVQLFPEQRSLLREHHFITRDSRMKERKKPGLKRARRAPQWSKR